MAYLIHELLSEDLVHNDVTTVAGGDGLAEYTREPIKNAHADPDPVVYRKGPTKSLDTSLLGSVKKPFRQDGGLRLMTGNIGRGVMKISAVKEEHWIVEAPAIVISHQNDLMDMHKAGELERDFIAVVRFQGPAANGMPELHKLTPVLGSLQDKGFKVALITDGRMSGASGKVPAAIHMHPEALHGGPIAKIETGDIIRLDAGKGIVEVLNPDLEARPLAKMPPATNLSTLGMNMFAPLRDQADNAEAGASVLGDPQWMQHLRDTKND